MLFVCLTLALPNPPRTESVRTSVSSSISTEFGAMNTTHQMTVPLSPHARRNNRTLKLFNHTTNARSYF